MPAVAQASAVRWGHVCALGCRLYLQGGEDAGSSRLELITNICVVCRLPCFLDIYIVISD